MKRIFLSLLLIAAAAGILPISGCGGYQNSWLYPEEVQTVYVEMFDTTSFRRGYEFQLTNAICKRLEATTPYKIVTDRDVADSILSGTMSIKTGVLSMNRYTGQPLETESTVTVEVNWKNIKTGQLYIQGQTVEAAASYSDDLGQTSEYSIGRAVNKAAVQVVELMEKPW